MDVVSRLRASADSFVWQAGVTPLSSPWLLVAVPAAYVCGVFALRRALAGRALPLGPLPALHNAVLMLWSAAMFCGTAHAAWTYTRAEHSAAWLVCLPVGTRVAGRLYWWSYVYFISKFYELLDTVLRVLKAQPLSFLHLFHHAVVLLMSYGWLQFAQSLQVIGLLTNTGIHVVMYTYYLLCSIGVKPGKAFKRAVTNGQIVQFLFSLAVSVPFVYIHLTSRDGCSGFGAWVGNVAFNIVLLALFAQFHRKTYKEAGAAKKMK